PLIRTSPDHGTAFDLAPQIKANPSSMIEAIKTALKMARIKV
ncbi:MAG TPA: 4-hydroxythreonine-4-phosphate dehydrogenase PdxA, partial [SAR324 cluster bacterium]|nr:4-hydroxythreonine-4-phosphate dehydrogenase PdxA [SAR324 cluster bacterium]